MENSADVIVTTPSGYSEPSCGHNGGSETNFSPRFFQREVILREIINRKMKPDWRAAAAEMASESEASSTMVACGVDDLD